MVIWLIGLSGSGKTTIGKKLFDKLKKSKDKWFFLDGDIFRSILGEDLGHTIEDRRKNAFRISRFCEYLNYQGINVLACVLSIFHENQKYNKENIGNYKEAYIDVNFENLLKRDNKDLYKQALNGQKKNVVGVDIEFKPPYSPDLIRNNNPENTNFEKILKNIIDKFSIKIDNDYSYTTNNLLNFPQKYQFSQYEGKDFFEIYKKDRIQTLDFLKKRLEKITDKNIDNINFNNKSYISNNNLILKDFLIYLNNAENQELEKQKKNIILLIKRFEVSKKLFSTYEIVSMKKTSTKFEELINYSLFSLVVQKFYHTANEQNKLLYLNTILKINDIISSTSYNLILYKEIYYSVSAISNELEIIKDYIK